MRTTFMLFHLLVRFIKLVSLYTAKNAQCTELDIRALCMKLRRLCVGLFNAGECFH